MIHVKVKVNYLETLNQVIKENGSWLDDQIIKASMDTLKNQYPTLRGFYNTLLGVNLSFPVTKPPFIQILHVHNNHWITVEAVTAKFVRVYDSLFDSSDISAQMQIAALMRTPEPAIELDIQRTQFQVGSSDCGLFSIAYATDLAYGNNPASYRYKQELLRSHLEAGLCNNSLLPFPSTEVHALKPKKERIRIYCTCRLPDDCSRRMAQCHRCQEWYHEDCENIPLTVFTNHHKIWKCNQCT